MLLLSVSRHLLSSVCRALCCFGVATLGALSLSPPVDICFFRFFPPCGFTHEAFDKRGLFYRSIGAFDTFYRSVIFA